MNQVKSSHSYPGPDIDTDYKMVMANSNVRLGRIKRPITKYWYLEGFEE